MNTNRRYGMHMSTMYKNLYAIRFEISDVTL